MYKALKADLPINHADQYLLKNIKVKKQSVTVQHYYGRYGIHGRQYSTNGMRNMSQDTLARVAGPNYVHLELGGGSCSLMLNLAIKNNVQISEISRLFNNRTREDIAASEGMDAKMFEDALTRSTKLGNYHYVTANRSVQFLDDFLSMATAIWTELIPLYPAEYDFAYTVATERKKFPRDVFADVMLQKAEAAWVQSLSKYCEEQKLTIGENMWNGLLVLKSPMITPLFLVNARAYIKSTTGLDGRVVDKPLVQTSKKEYDAPGKLLLFETDAIEGRKKNDLKKLTEAGIKIGIFSEMSKESLDAWAENIREQIGMNFDILLSAKDCYEPDIKYRYKNGLSQFEKCKSLQQHFKQHVLGNRIRIVDDNPQRFRAEERAMVLPEKFSYDRLLKDFNYTPRPFDDVPYLEEYREEEMFPYIRNGVEMRSINPIIFQDGVRCIAIASHMGSGKSKASLKMLKADQLQHPGEKRRYLFISARIQQAHTYMALLKKMGAKLYSDVEGSLASVDFLICQAESLCRLQGCKPFDIIIIDEERSVGAQFTVANTNKSNLTVNNKFLRLFMAQPQCKTLLMDAHLEVDGMVKDFMEEVFKPHEMRVYRYDHNPMKRSIIRYNGQFGGEMQIMGAVMEAINAKKRIICIFRSKKNMHKIIARMQQPPEKPGEYTAPKIQWFDGDTVGETMACFQKIDDFITDNNIDVLCWTSKVTVGSDIQVPIDSIFCFCDTKGGSSPRDVFQSMGRARNLVSGNIHVLLGIRDSMNDRVLTVDSAYREIIDNRYLRNDFISVLSTSGAGFVNGVLVWTPDPICKQYAYSMAEQNTGFNIGFEKLVRFSGLIEKRIIPSRPVTKDSMKEANEQANALELGKILSVLAQQREVPITKGDLAELHKKHIRQKDTDEELLMVKYLKPYFKYDEKFRPKLTPVDILCTIENASILNNAKAFRMKPERRNRQDALNLKYASYPEYVQNRVAMHDKLTEACNLAGFTGLTGTTSLSTMMANKEKILELTTQVAKIDKRRVQGAKDPSMALQRELKKVGYDFEADREQKNGVREKVYTIVDDCDLKVMGHGSIKLSRLLPHYNNGPISDDEIAIGEQMVIRAIEYLPGTSAEEDEAHYQECIRNYYRSLKDGEPNPPNEDGWEEEPVSKKQRI